MLRHFIIGSVTQNLRSQAHAKIVLFKAHRLN
jgi:hypothetical protein